MGDQEFELVKEDEVIEEAEEHDDSEDYRECEICGDNYTKIRCPQIWHDLGKKGTIAYYVCDNCCIDNLFFENKYISDGCTGDCNTGRPEKFFKEKLKEWATENDLIGSTKYKGNFLNKDKTILFGNCGLTKDSYPDFIDARELKIPEAIYSGEYATFIKIHFEEIKVFDIEWILEAKDFFKEMREKWEEVTLYSHRDTLLIRGYFNFALIQESNNSKDMLERETPVFHNSILNGIEFFNIHLQKPIVL